MCIRDRCPRFNCQLDTQAVSCVTVGIVKSVSVNTTRTFEVPFLTNCIAVEEGEELIMEVQEKIADKPAGKRTWKHAFLDEERRKKLSEFRKGKAEASEPSKGRGRLSAAVTDD